MRWQLRAVRILDASAGMVEPPTKSE